jgi:hypothetical protein
MTAHFINIQPNSLRLTRDNPYNLYNFEAKIDFSQKITCSFSQRITALLKGAAPCEPGKKRLALTGTVWKGGEISC